MRDGLRPLTLIALGALGALTAVILTGNHTYRESGTSSTAGVLVDTGGSGGGGQTTQVFTVDGDWDLLWSYDCSPSLDNLFRTFDHCDFFLTVKQMSDCQVSPDNQGIKGHRTQDQGVVHYHAGGTFYFVVDSYGSWTFTVTGSGRGWGEGPAAYCSEG